MHRHEKEDEWYTCLYSSFYFKNLLIELAQGEWMYCNRNIFKGSVFIYVGGYMSVQNIVISWVYNCNQLMKMTNLL